MVGVEVEAGEVGKQQPERNHGNGKHCHDTHDERDVRAADSVDQQGSKHTGHRITSDDGQDHEEACTGQHAHGDAMKGRQAHLTPSDERTRRCPLVVRQGRAVAEGQELLLDPKIRRLPVNPKTYAKAPADFPNPFKDKSIGAAVKFDLDLSKNRYNVVNSLFDVMVTYRMDDLVAATKAIQDAEGAMKGKSNPAAAKLIAEARALLGKVPVDEATAGKKEFAAIFKQRRRKASDKVTGRQAEIEQEWDTMVKANYAKAKELAEKAKSSL